MIIDVLDFVSGTHFKHTSVPDGIDFEKYLSQWYNLDDICWMVHEDNPHTIRVVYGNEEYILNHHGD